MQWEKISMGSRKPEKKGGNAVIYARYSSSNQREESIEQQVNKCREFAERNGYTVISVYSDAAISGKDDNRPQFQRMMRDSEKGAFDYVIAWKSSRIGRNMLQAMVNEERLAAEGVRCLYVEEDFDDTAAGRFALRNMMNVNQFYIENMAEDIKRGLMDNASKCMVNTRPPFGYKKGDDGKFAIRPEQAEIVREIFAKFLDGWAYVDIANELNRRGLKTVLGNGWNKGSFHSMLRNEMYAGVYLYRDVRIEGGVPEIISRKDFQEVQRQLQQRRSTRGKNTGSAEYMLTGKLFCGYCGEPMVGVSGTGRHGETHYYYRCQGRYKKKNGCEKKTVQRDWIEKLVIDYTKTFILQDEILDRIVDGYNAFIESARKDSALAAMEAELDQTRKAISNLIKAVELGIMSETTAERLRELEQQRTELEQGIRIEQAALSELSPDELRFYLERFREMDFDYHRNKQDLIRLFVQAIYLVDDSLKIVYNFDPADGHVISLQDINGSENSDASGLYEFLTGVLMPDGTNPVTVQVFLYGFVLSARL